MELRHLHTFIVVAEDGGFTKAAARIGYAQSSITAQIQALETELGVLLFDRLGKRIVLTEAGRRLLPYAQDMVRMHGAIRESVVLEEKPSGTLTIGAPESLAAFRLPAVIREYKRLYPQVKLILKPGLCTEMKELARTGEVDLAILLQPVIADPDFVIDSLVEEQMALIACPEHRLAEAEIVTPDDLRDEVLLYTENGCTYRAVFEQELLACGVTPEVGLEFFSIEAIKNCVMLGLGLALVPLITVQRELGEGKLLRLKWDDRSQRMTMQAAYHRKKWVTPALEEWLKLLGRYAEGWREAQES
ncbi:LysR family transcriptional regulator [Gorillibacterium timonense]|uniref:LysR family transcriptional regulator n=1 Tax=Gorillibacterium timonense TaxID=1689269 RepID=UPI00071C3726|nr:LysR family transcriptional regulator [Gorillibacterium timonense]